MNSSSSFEMIKKIFLLKLGSSQVLDSIYLFVICPMGILGTCLMTISLALLFQRDFRKEAFFQYLQVLTLANLIQAACMIFMYFKAPYYLFDSAKSMGARIYNCKILSSYVVALFFFYGDAIFLLLNLERMAIFSSRYKSFNKINPYLACFILLVVCELFNLPTFFVYNVPTDDEIDVALSSLENVLAFKGLCPKTLFGASLLGQGLNIFGYVVKGFIVLVIDVAINFLSVFCIRDFYKKKQILTNKRLSAAPNEVAPHTLNEINTG